MAEPTDATGAQGASEHEKPEQPTDQDQSLSNADIKNHPLFLKVTEQLSAMQKAESDRAEAADKAKREAEIKDAEAKGEFEKALKLKDEEHSRKIAEYESKILQRDLTTELLGQGFTRRAAAFLTSEYDAEQHGSAEDYAKACLADEANAQFLSAQPADPTKPKPPGTGKAGGGSGKIDWEQNKRDETSDDPEKRKQARANLRAWREANPGKGYPN